jgi:hypothetical protein
MKQSKNRKNGVPIIDYEEEFNIFSKNIDQAAYSFYYGIEIEIRIGDEYLIDQSSPDGSNLFCAMQDSARFWNYCKASMIFCSIMSICRILDKDSKSHTIKRLINAAQNSGLFTESSLLERVTKRWDTDKNRINDYMQRAYILSGDDFDKIKKFANDTRTESNPIKNLRNKILAHQDTLDENTKKEIFEKCEYKLIEKIIERLLTIKHIFEESFDNGKHPDFDYKNSDIKEQVNQDVQSLLKKLSRGHMQN